MGQFLRGIAAPTGDALARGDIDAGKADVIAVAVSVLDAEDAFKVQDELLPKAVLWTRHRVAREVATLVAAADPSLFTQRAARASTRRYVGRARVDVDGMAAHSVYWPAADALALDLLLDSAASSAKAAGDLRTLEQLRADVLADLAAHGLGVGQVGDLSGFSLQLRTGPCAHEHQHGDDVADRAGEQDEASAGDHGQITAGTATADSGSGPGSETETSAPATVGEADRDPARSREDQPESADVLRTGGSEGSGVPAADPAGGTEGTDVPSSSFGETGGFHGSWHGADTGADPRVFNPAPDRGLPRIWPVGVLGGRRAQILIRVPLSTLMGGDLPADVEGLGPIPADVARAFAAGGQWRRLVTDPITDRVIDYGTTRYIPPQNMADRIKENEPHCTAPGCSATARMTELDHRIPFPLGPTSDDNLDPKCRRCHLLKTHGDFEDEVDAHGNRFWRTPTGHVYMRTPDGTITELPRTRPASSGGPSYRTAPDPDEPAPF
ncbi:HNH endonuclease [Occultella glacieicola]|uniref:HNH endonuclease n=1 Tax=Occultella glacieicola TaxID=2518684 RepID=A0ABY2E272_9MICO|nr:HNH endonuclease signature motif containing protein [Occultella glacieicola]TDE92699.1 HNH endonuclease [Occultella glacieicola]